MLWHANTLSEDGAIARLILVRSLFDRPLLRGNRGWVIAGWIHDVWLAPPEQRVAAFEVREVPGGNLVYVAPFPLQRNAYLEDGLDADLESWTPLDRAPTWTSARNIQEVTIFSSDGEWSGELTDAECDPLSWRVMRYRVRQPGWKIFGMRTLAANLFASSAADVIIVDRQEIAQSSAAGK